MTVYQLERTIMSISRRLGDCENESLCHRSYVYSGKIFKIWNFECCALDFFCSCKLFFDRDAIWKLLKEFSVL